MKVGVLGTGMVGQALAGKLSALGHDVMVGTRDPDDTMARTEPDAFGDPAFAVWRGDHPEVGLGTLPDTAAHGEMIVNATNGAASVDALEAAGEGNLDGKVLMDVANPLDFSEGMPPFLAVCNTDSLGEQIQRRFPGARVVKALNTMTAPLMVDPSRLANGDHTVFVCGDDDGAKAEVSALLESFGWTDIIDLGPISAARGTEAVLPIWLRVWGALDLPRFQFKVVR